MEGNTDTFCYIYSSSLGLNIQLKVGTLVGHSCRPEYGKLLDHPLLRFSGSFGSMNGRGDLLASIQVFEDCTRALSLPVYTSYKYFTSRWNWNQWITVPISYADVPRNAQLCITFYDCAGPRKRVHIGGTTICLFGKSGVLRQGLYDMKVWPGVEADSTNPSSTPGRMKSPCSQDQMQKLAKLAKKHRNGQMSKVDWLDRLSFREIELINEEEKKMTENLYLVLEFPRLVIRGQLQSIVYFEKDGDEVVQHRSQPDSVILPDYEILQDNIVEIKHHKLARSLRSGVSARELKPTSGVRDVLLSIISYSPTTPLSTEEQDLIWKYRFYLSTKKKALTKFIKCVNWRVPGEERQAMEMLNLWSPPDPEDALELLGPAFTHPIVRRYAIKRLDHAGDDDLMLYILQLVQALKYESFSDIKAASESSYNALESMRNAGSWDRAPDDRRVANRPYGDPDFRGDLASFLISRACQNSTLANNLFWYLSIECEEQSDPISVAKEDSRIRKMYVTVMKMFTDSLSSGGITWQDRRAFLNRQKVFIDQLVSLVKIVARESGNRRKKMERLRALLAESDASSSINFSNFEAFPFPLDPTVSIKGIIPNKATLFKSALMPSKLTFLTANDEEYIAIFKHGDDLRQDQLILQTIALMDKLWRRENLDLKLTPYRVLATSVRHGFLQFIESTTVAEVLAHEGSILNFFRKFNPSEIGPYGVEPGVMDTYIRSCAGYCIITYVLGVGDRHLDNLLLTTSGKLFHIDFGYILGRDPKPLPPPMKLSREMVEAMGGVGSEHYYEFRKQCYTAFLHLRRHGNLILNLFSLMVDATIPDIALEPDKAVKKIQDKLCMNMSDEEAVHYVQNLLDLSVTAVMAALVEQFHKFAQYWRK